MTLTQSCFQSILLDLIEENSFACRAALSLSEVRFSSGVETACVTIQRRPILKVNPEFLRQHCQTEAHVKAVLIHEFLHILLRHTFEIRNISPLLNLALDATINAMIHRKLGPEYSSFMSTYYAKAKGPLKLLRPPIPNEQYPVQSEQQRLWIDIYRGHAQYQDVIEFFKGKALLSLEWAMRDSRPVFIGNHDPNTPFDVLDLPEALAKRLRESARILAGDDSMPGNRFQKPHSIDIPPAERDDIAAWKAQTFALLRRLSVSDTNAAKLLPMPASVRLPIPSSSDRRGLLRLLWNPLLTDMSWDLTQSVPIGSVLVYLDVSGSMDRELQAIVQLLKRCGPAIRRPFFAFSTLVTPATIKNDRLVTASTGGTELRPVIEHLRATRPPKALVITDGYVEKLNPADAATPHTHVEALLSPHGDDSILRKIGWNVHTLAHLPT